MAKHGKPKHGKRKHVNDVTFGAVHHIGVADDGATTVWSSTHGVVIDGHAYQGNTVSIDGDQVWVDGELID
jgi:hypothetical protein